MYVKPGGGLSHDSARGRISYARRIGNPLSDRLKHDQERLPGVWHSFVRRASHELVLFVVIFLKLGTLISG
jgi:hypothetical protein